MSKRPKITPVPYYILTAADGFTTICVATQKALNLELARVPLLAPIHVASWTPTGDGIREVGWRKLDEWEI